MAQLFYLKYNVDASLRIHWIYDLGDQQYRSYQQGIGGMQRCRAYSHLANSNLLLHLLQTGRNLQ